MYNEFDLYGGYEPAYEGFKDTIISLKDAIVNKIKYLFGKIVGFVKSAKKKIGTAITKVMAKFINKEKSKIGKFLINRKFVGKMLAKYRECSEEIQKAYNKVNNTADGFITIDVDKIGFEALEASGNGGDELDRRQEEMNRLKDEAHDKKEKINGSIHEMIEISQNMDNDRTGSESFDDTQAKKFLDAVLKETTNDTNKFMNNCVKDFERTSKKGINTVNNSANKGSNPTNNDRKESFKKVMKIVLRIITTLAEIILLFINPKIALCLLLLDIGVGCIHYGLKSTAKFAESTKKFADIAANRANEIEGGLIERL